MSARDRDKDGSGWVGPELDLPPVTASTLALAVILTLAFWNDWSVDSLLMGSEALSTQPWRLLSSTLVHGDGLHLLFNLYWIWHFGHVVERRFGAWVTLALFLWFSAGSAIAEFTFLEGGIGLSGLCYGLFGFSLVLRRADPELRRAVDFRTVLWLVGWFFLSIALTVSGSMAIANVAHGAGFVFGVLAGAAMNPGRRLAGWRWACGGVFLAVWGLGRFGRDQVNLSGTLADQYLYDSYSPSDDGDHAKAAELLRKALEHDDRHADARSELAWNLGMMGRYLEGLAHVKMALSEGPSDALAHARAGWLLLELGRAEEALEAIDRSIELDSTAAWVHQNRGCALLDLGRYQEAVEACDACLERDPTNAGAAENRRIALESLDGG